MKDLIKIELLKNIDSFINELDLTMDCLKADTIVDIKKYISNIKENNNEFDDFIKYTRDHLRTFEVQLSSILFSKKKINTSYYIFLNDIILFQNLLHFKIFENEVKNTKKDFVKYLYNIYMCVVFINGGDSAELSTFINKIEDEAKTLKDSDIKKEKLKNRRNAIYELPVPVMQVPVMQVPTMPMPFDLSKLMTGAGCINGLDDIMSSILGNTDILNIATDISKQMQDQQMNPMMMLSELMSGNIANSPLQGLVNSIQEKVDNKINSGEINREELENQAQSIVNSLGDKNMNNMSGMADLVKEMSEKMKQEAQPKI